MRLDVLLDGAATDAPHHEVNLVLLAHDRWHRVEELGEDVDLDLLRPLAGLYGDEATPFEVDKKSRVGFRLS